MAICLFHWTQRANVHGGKFIERTLNSSENTIQERNYIYSLTITSQSLMIRVAITLIGGVQHVDASV